MGRKSDADRELAAELAAADTPKTVDSNYDAARYFLGQDKKNVLFSDAAALKKKQPEYADSDESDAWYFVGLKQLANGHIAAAIKNFRRVLSFRQHDFPVRQSTHAWLRELRRKRR